VVWLHSKEQAKLSLIIAAESRFFHCWVGWANLATCLVHLLRSEGNSESEDVEPTAALRCRWREAS
jgi:hypothetical protein